MHLRWWNMLLALLLTCGAHASGGDTLKSRLQIHLRGGVALPVGRFAGDPGNSGRGADSADMLGAGAATGHVLSLSANYIIKRSLGVRVSLIATGHDRLNDNYIGYPWQCDRCGLGYIAPTTRTTTLSLQPWRSTNMVVGPSYTFQYNGYSFRTFAGLGYQRWISGEVLVSETGSQMVYSGSPPFPMLPFGRTLLQPCAVVEGAVYEVGAEVVATLVRRLAVSVGVDVMWGGLRFRGDQIYTHAGATQSQESYYYNVTVPYVERSGMTRLSFQVGVGLDLVRTAARH